MEPLTSLGKGLARKGVGDFRLKSLPLLVAAVIYNLPAIATAQAQTPTSTPGPTSHVDIEVSCTYFFPGQGTTIGPSIPVTGAENESANAQASSSCFPVESSVQRTFNGNTYTLHAFSGKYVQWEVPDSW